MLRIIDHPDMFETARTMVRRLGISGLCGFDFILEEGTGRASFIELNLRATPTCHLVSADGVDLLASLRSALGYGESTGRINNYPGGLVALFPQEMNRDPASPYLCEAFHDVPDHSHEFVARVSANSWTLTPWKSTGGRAPNAVSVRRRLSNERARDEFGCCEERPRNSCQDEIPDHLPVK